MSRFQDLSPGQRRAVATGVVVAVLLMLVLAAEAAVRVRAWIKYGGMWGIEQTYMRDAETGLRIPVAGSVTGGIRINSLGFRSPEIPERPPPGTVRVAFLGASTTYSAEVAPNEATWPHRVVDALADRWPDTRFDYVNAGVPGYTVRTSLENLERRVRRLHPDVIVIYHAVNDFALNVRMLAEHGAERSRGEQSMLWPSRYSLLWFLAEKNLRVMALQARALDSRGKMALDSSDISVPFRTDLSALVEAAQTAAEVVALVTLSHRARRDQPPEVLAESVQTTLLYTPDVTAKAVLVSMEAYNDVIRAVAERTGVLLIEGEHEIPGDAVHFVDSVHFTAAGSRLMAERVTRALAESQILDRIARAEAGG